MKMLNIKREKLIWVKIEFYPLEGVYKWPTNQFVIVCIKCIICTCKITLFLAHCTRVAILFA